MEVRNAPYKHPFIIIIIIIIIVIVIAIAIVIVIVIVIIIIIITTNHFISSIILTKWKIITVKNIT